MTIEELMNITNPLFVSKRTTENIILLGGIFEMKDQVGFPFDMCYEICKENSLGIDYCDLLAKCWLNDCLKFDSMVRDIRNVLGDETDIIIKRFHECGAIWLSLHPEAKLKENPIDEYCKAMIEQSQEEHTL